MAEITRRLNPGTGPLSATAVFQSRKTPSFGPGSGGVEAAAGATTLVDCRGGKIAERARRRTGEPGYFVVEMVVAARGPVRVARVP